MGGFVGPEALPQGLAGVDVELLVVGADIEPRVGVRRGPDEFPFLAGLLALLAVVGSRERGDGGSVESDRALPRAAYVAGQVEERGFQDRVREPVQPLEPQRPLRRVEVVRKTRGQRLVPFGLAASILRQR